ncbi:MAG: AraC family transcriptional regulator [Gammaproteobacteria bacterium]|nr:AraC family transcriptional regulator [Gammaproteobacteria bacterium]
MQISPQPRPGTTLAALLEDYRNSRGGHAPSGVISTGVPRVTFFWNDQPIPRAPLLYDAGIVIVGQGHKVGFLGGRRFEYDADTCLVLGVPVPFECEVHASPTEPLLGIRIDIDITSLQALVARVGGGLGADGKGNRLPHAGVEPVSMNGPLLDASKRLIECLADPVDRQVVGPAVVDEIIYRILRGEQGHVLYTLTQHHTPYAGIARALARMHRDYRDTLPVEALAKESAMSVSAFHRAFKMVTGDSPLQYLKKIRLLKARGLLVFDGARVDEAAYKVGYASASQFSREFKSYFQVPPSLAHSLPYTDAP